MKQIIILITLFSNLGLTFSQISVPDELQFHCSCGFHGSTSQLQSHSFHSLSTQISGCSPVLNLIDRQYDHLFIPKPNYAIHTIQVNLFFIQRNDGSGNFQENNSEHQLLWDDIENEVNSTFQNLINISNTECYTGNTYVNDTRIRFQFNRYYIMNNSLWDNQNNYNNLCPDRDYSWFLNSLDNDIVNNQSIPRGINIYFTEYGQNYMDLVVNRLTDDFSQSMACSEYPDFENYTASSRIHMPNYYTKYWWMKNICPQIYGQPWDPVIREWYLQIGRGIAHEIGHSLWLFHDSPYYSDNGECIFTLMRHQGDGPRNFLPPSEVGRMYSSMSLSNVRTFVNEDTYNPVPIELSTGKNLTYQMRLFQDLDVILGGNLTSSCRLEFAREASLNIKNGGNVILNNSQVGSYRNNWQGGVSVKSGGSLFMMNNAIIENGENGFSVDLGATFECTEGEIR